MLVGLIMLSTLMLTTHVGPRYSVHLVTFGIPLLFSFGLGKVSRLLATLYSDGKLTSSCGCGGGGPY